jgi:hypothetical protein
MSNEREPLVPVGYGSTDNSGVRLDPEAGRYDDVPAGYERHRSLTHYRVRKSAALIWTIYTVAITVLFAICLGYFFLNQRDEPPDSVCTELNSETF